MFELVLVVVLLVGLAGLAVMPALWGFYGGAAVTAFSLVLGTIAGIGYHVLLARCLGSLPRGWWWNPTIHHDELPESARDRVLRWFYAGAAGFVGCMVGMVMVVTGALKTL